MWLPVSGSIFSRFYLYTIFADSKISKEAVVEVWLWDGLLDEVSFVNFELRKVRANMMA